MHENNQTRNCIVCGGRSAEPYCAFGRHQYVRCSECNLLYVAVIPTTDEMMRAYKGKGLRSLRRRLIARFRKIHHHRDFGQSMERARQIDGFSSGNPGLRDNAGIRFLDIGCNRGYLLSAGIERGADVYGIELVPVLMMPFCNTYPEFSEHVFSDKLSAVASRFTHGFFDLITAIDVVEHFEDPASDMKHICRMLKEGGVAVFQTPDADCEKARSERCQWGALKPLEHLHLFDRNNFKDFSLHAGFREISFHEPFDQDVGNFVAVLRK